MSVSEPGRDDGSLPPVNIVIPDDARELDRDVLAYRRELRARRRRQRLLRLLGPFRIPEFGGQAAIVPLIAACLAISLVGGALLSVVTMSPAAAPTLSRPESAPRPSSSPTALSPRDLSPLPAGSVTVGGRPVAVRSLVTSAIAVVSADCGCEPALGRLAQQAVAADVALYFAGSGTVIGQLPGLTARYGDGAAVAAADGNDVLGTAFHPAGLTVLLVFADATAEAVRNLNGNFNLTPVLRELKQPGARLSQA